MSGHYAVAFEASVFTPCGAPKGWWVDRLESAPSVQAAVNRRLRGGSADLAVLYVHWQGVVRDSGGYGHGGQYASEFTPSRVFGVRDSSAADCR